MTTEQNAGQNTNFSLSVNPVHICGRVNGFGISQALRQFQRSIKVHAFALHFRQHKVGRSVDDAVYFTELIGRQALIHRRDDRCATAYAGLKQKANAFAARQLQQFGTMRRHQFFIGGSHMSAAFQCSFHVRVSHFGSANGLYDHLHFRIRQNRRNVFHKQMRVRMLRKIPNITNVFYFHRLAGALSSLGRVSPQDF